MDENLLNETVTIVLKDRQYHIGKLTLRQVLQLSKFLTKALILNQKRMKQLKEVPAEGSTNVDDIVTVLDVLGDDDAVKFFSIILQEADLKFLDQALDFNSTLMIITAICEVNDFQSIKKNFQKLIGLINQPSKDQA